MGPTIATRHGGPHRPANARTTAPRGQSWAWRKTKENNRNGQLEYQIAKIIYLLSLELEDRDMTDVIISTIKEVLGETTDTDNTKLSGESEIIVR